MPDPLQKRGRVWSHRYTRVNRCSDVRIAECGHDQSDCSAVKRAYVLPRAREIITIHFFAIMAGVRYQRDTELQCLTIDSDAVRALGNDGLKPEQEMALNALASRTQCVSPVVVHMLAFALQSHSSVSDGAVAASRADIDVEA